MILGEVAVGAMNLYAHVPDGFTDDGEAVGMDLAGAAGAVLSNVSAYWTAFDISRNLNEAMKTRAVIDLLRKASQRENVKLRFLASRIVERRPLSLGQPKGGTS